MPNPRTRYSLSNLYHPGMRGFERIATRGNKKCGLSLYLIHTFGPIACIKSDVRWYKYIYMYGGTCAIIVVHASICNVGGVRPKLFFVCAGRFKRSNQWKLHGH